MAKYIEISVRVLTQTPHDNPEERRAIRQTITKALNTKGYYDVLLLEQTSSQKSTREK